MSEFADLLVEIFDRIDKLEQRLDRVDARVGDSESGLKFDDALTEAQAKVREDTDRIRLLRGEFAQRIDAFLLGLTEIEQRNKVRIHGDSPTSVTGIPEGSGAAGLESLAAPRCPRPGCCGNDEVQS